MPVYVEIEYEAGNPVAVDGRRLSPAALLERVNRIGGEHGIGRVDLVENRFVGMKSRGVYETPGGTILHAAHRALESITLDREVAAPARLAGAALRGDDLLRLLVRPEREAVQGLMDDVPGRRDRHRAPQALQGHRARWRAANRRGPSTGRTS